MPPRFLHRTACALLAAALVLPVVADTVTLRDGTRLEGAVLTLDEEDLVLLLDSGKKERIPRDRVARMDLEPPAEKPAVKVEMKNISSDDALYLWINEVAIFENSPSTRQWIDVTDAVRDGANEIRFQVHNDVGVWAYRWAVRVNGRQPAQFECGRSPATGCTGLGGDGREIGVMSLDSVWLYYDERTGEVEIEEE